MAINQITRKNGEKYDVEAETLEEPHFALEGYANRRWGV